MSTTTTTTTDTQFVVVAADVSTPVTVGDAVASRETLLATLGAANTETIFVADGAAAIVTSAHPTTGVVDINVRATQVAERFQPGFAARSRVRGTAVVVGLDTDPDSENIYAPVPADIVAFIDNMWGRREPGAAPGAQPVLTVVV